MLIDAPPPTGSVGCIWRIPTPSAIESNAVMPKDSNSTSSLNSPPIREVATEPALAEEQKRDVHISASAYLRSMWSILAHSFCSPFTTTIVDLTTGRVVDEK